MRLLARRTSIFITIIAFSFCGVISAQESVKPQHPEGKVTIDQDPRIEKLIAYKSELNKSNNDKRFRIQIYNGTLEGAEKAEREFTKKFDDISCNISFETPNYKVRVGKFRNRLEADRYLMKVRQEYPSAFLLQP
ncbi:SPOR domain-containing protein [Galbibacter sp.]|uniref:SPOR domain-containing protein n=1 Tax=Galbibacter sp. TaxID=2918471 RepID=UPI003A924E3A